MKEQEDFKDENDYLKQEKIYKKNENFLNLEKIYHEEDYQEKDYQKADYQRNDYQENNYQRQRNKYQKNGYQKQKNKRKKYQENDFSKQNQEEIKDKKNKNLFYFGVFFLLFFIFFIFSFFIVFFNSTNILTSTQKCIALYPINGVITTQSAEESLFSQRIKGSLDIAKEIERLNENENIKAIVFVINSPGGSVIATKDIYEAAKKINKPTISYYRDVSASGALYFSMASDEIYSHPDTLTGSIGVRFSLLNYAELYEKIGLKDISIASGDLKDIGSGSREMTQKEYDVLMSIVNETFQDFLNAIINSRKDKLNMNKFNEITDGRLLSGKQALEIGLVDKTGSLNDAINRAKELSGDPNLGICDYTKTRVSNPLFFNLRNFLSNIIEDIILKNNFYELEFI